MEKSKLENELRALEKKVELKEKKDHDSENTGCWVMIGWIVIIYSPFHIVLSGTNSNVFFIVFTIPTIIGMVAYYSIKNRRKKELDSARTEMRNVQWKIKKIKQKEITAHRNKGALNEIKRINKLKEKQKLVLLELDKDNDGLVDGLGGEDDFRKLLEKYQDKILAIDRAYIQQFVKVSNYLKTKKSNIQKIFNSLDKTNYENELYIIVKLLKNQVHAYQLVLLNSFNMITALINDDMITFYEIHDSFDKLNMFNSNWENEVSNKLTNIGDNIQELIYSIQSMEYSIVNELHNLGYVTEELKESVTKELSEVQSSIDTNNLLTSIQTYQLYKINKNTKGLN